MQMVQKKKESAQISFLWYLVYVLDDKEQFNGNLPNDSFEWMLSYFLHKWMGLNPGQWPLWFGIMLNSISIKSQQSLKKVAVAGFTWKLPMVILSN